MYEVKALSFTCEKCGRENVNEFDEGDTLTRCIECLTAYEVDI